MQPHRLVSSGRLGRRLRNSFHVGVFHVVVEVFVFITERIVGQIEYFCHERLVNLLDTYEHQMRHR